MISWTYKRLALVYRIKMDWIWHFDFKKKKERVDLEKIYSVRYEPKLTIKKMCEILV